MQELTLALKFIREHATEDIGVQDVVDAVVLSQRMLERKFRSVLNRTPRKKICTTASPTAKTMLAGTIQPILDVSLASGFPGAANFSAVFKRETGIAPAAISPAIPDRPRQARTAGKSEHVIVPRLAARRSRMATGNSAALSFQRRGDATGPGVRQHTIG